MALLVYGAKYAIKTRTASPAILLCMYSEFSLIWPGFFCASFLSLAEAWTENGFVFALFFVNWGIWSKWLFVRRYHDVAIAINWASDWVAVPKRSRHNGMDELDRTKNWIPNWRHIMGANESGRWSMRLWVCSNFIYDIPANCKTQNNTIIPVMISFEWTSPPAWTRSECQMRDKILKNWQASDSHATISKHNPHTLHTTMSVCVCVCCVGHTQPHNRICITKVGRMGATGRYIHE